MEATLLRSCLSFPKFNFVLRSCPPSHIQQSAKDFDSLMRDALSDLAGGPLSDWVWKRATLPSSMGGLNLRSASLHASAAFISSLDQCQPLITRETYCHFSSPDRSHFCSRQSGYTTKLDFIRGH